MSLRLSADLALPLDAITQTFLVVGKRGSGKSNTAARFVEQLHRARLPFVVLDPVDTWWGLKAGRDGSKGLDVYVFGGRKQDLPLEASKGSLIAEVLCEHRISMVLSVKHLSGRERSTFMVDFARTLFQKWAGGPLHLVLEEAHELAPQSTQNAREGEQQMLGAFKRLWKLGRSSGIGGTAITQRPASLSKDITTQSEILIAHRTIGPQDVKAIGEWIKYHGERLDLLAELPSLPTGQAFVWAPEFPEGRPIGLQRTTIPLRETYDSASTPKVGEKRVEPKVLAEVDLERLRAKMAATIERAKAEDPKELRQRIAQLERAVRDAKAATPAPAPQPLEVPVFRNGELDRLTGTAAQLATIGEQFDDLGRQLGTLGQQLVEQARMISGAVAGARAPRPPAARAIASPTRMPSRIASAPSRRRAAEGQSAGQVPASQQRILNALVWLESVRIPAAPKTQVALLADQSPTSGGFFNNLGALRSAGLIDYPRPAVVSLTDAGRTVATPADIPTTDAEVHEQLYRRLSGSQVRILRELIAVYPEPMGKNALAVATDQSATSGGYFNNLGRLRSLGLIDYPRPGMAVALPVLFVGGS